MTIGIAADHAGFEQKGELLKLLADAGYEVKDFGAYAYDSVDDYPDVVLPLAEAVSKGEITKGIAVCGSGVGVSVAANKVPGVRSALIMETYSAHQGVEHDDMNLLCLGGRVIGVVLMWEIVQAYLKAHYDGGERFQRRLDKVIAIENKYIKP
ncbi:RpiB/LacA/LacB family sugar-phosphate isomerase [Mucilaginibacter polytrichastri]|uniref:Putative sugar phosphate isomerase ywlF n=1 Tax=Mucilaginibacter polytrichastri TaxID=1302689 RepID=A0A1Q5ZYN5_9SPHI|nr:RpiB/LacA/LacB family sugar-phosphate isomerase [Mucilaginibacter polytrichastri]OKS86866.1 Putative sugar phosphate isomerase ywlF [Mucilaginibacter polytrichastri]SFT17569.1 ribose 5-phosphate isomerase B [Mucilaginibacter polytrichastri]